MKSYSTREAACRPMMRGCKSTTKAAQQQHVERKHETRSRAPWRHQAFAFKEIVVGNKQVLELGNRYFQKEAVGWPWALVRTVDDMTSVCGLDHHCVVVLKIRRAKGPDRHTGNLFKHDPGKFEVELHLPQADGRQVVMMEAVRTDRMALFGQLAQEVGMQLRIAAGPEIGRRNIEPERDHRSSVILELGIEGQKHVTRRRRPLLRLGRTCGQDPQQEESHAARQT